MSSVAIGPPLKLPLKVIPTSGPIWNGFTPTCEGIGTPVLAKYVKLENTRFGFAVLYVNAPDGVSKSIVVGRGT